MIKLTLGMKNGNRKMDGEIETIDVYACIRICVGVFSQAEQQKPGINR